MNDGPIAVFGSINMDVVVRVPRHPAPGETILGHGHFRSPGGKGANQAVAAAILGRSVSMIGRVGNDAEGGALLDNLRARGVTADLVMRDPERATGMAFIQVDDAGENSIVVSPGANEAVSDDDVERCKTLLEDARVTLLQLEVPLDAVETAARAVRGTVILNAAPATEVPEALLDEVDVLIANAGELAALTGSDPSAQPDALAIAARALRGPSTVIVTLGRRGALVVSGDSHVVVPGFTVEVVDTTGAGDAFCGAVADALARGCSLEEAARWANAAGALSVTKAGAQAALPNPAGVEELLKE